MITDKNHGIAKYKSEKRQSGTTGDTQTDGSALDKSNSLQVILVEQPTRPDPDPRYRGKISGRFFLSFLSFLFIYYFYFLALGTRDFDQR